jgi:leucyl-tRNA---protein transferase
MDALWASGWRHFGPLFFRRYLMEYGGQIKSVQPLRIALDRVRLSKSQRRVLRRNQDLRYAVAPTVVDDEQHGLFAAHVRRFRVNVPPSLESFLGAEPGAVPCPNVTLQVRRDEKLVAASYLDVGEKAVSSVYATFDPEQSSRSLGILTMLKEMEYATARDFVWYYPGYACHEPSPYDYKKQFAGTEWYDWHSWRPLTRSGA